MKEDDGLYLWPSVVTAGNKFMTTYLATKREAQDVGKVCAQG